MKFGSSAWPGLIAYLWVIAGIWLLGLSGCNRAPAHPPWKNAPPDPHVILAPGDQVYISSNRDPDSFDGIFTIDSGGMVAPRYFTTPVKVGGLSEVDASKAVLDRSFVDNVYKPTSSIRISVVKAARF